MMKNSEIQKVLADASLATLRDIYRPDTDLRMVVDRLSQISRLILAEMPIAKTKPIANRIRRRR